MPKERTIEQSIAIPSVIEHICKNTLIKCRTDFSIKSDSPDCMWEGIQLKNGELKINPDLLHPGDLLHEAGHLATTPQDIRSLMTGNLNNHQPYQKGLVELFQDKPRYLYASDQAAIGWSILAALKLGIDLSLVFENGFYEDPERVSEKARAIAATTGTRTSNVYLVELFYLGLIQQKHSSVPIAWDIELV